jgi:hypothetical protein
MTIGKQSKLNVAQKRRIVFVRDGETCIAKGVFGFCGGDLTVQHRAGRGMGGSANQDGFENLLTMCSIHNELETASPDFHRLCVKYGWSMPRWVHDQGLADVVPVWYPNRGWFFLEDDGRHSMLPNGTARANMIAIYGADFFARPSDDPPGE